MSNGRDTPLSGLRVAITRPEHQTAELESLLIRQGAEVLCTPLIAIELVDANGLREDADKSDAVGNAVYDWTVFTSANAVNAFFIGCNRREGGDRIGRHSDQEGPRGSDPLIYRSIPAGFVAAIGTATAVALRKFDVDADLIPNQFVTNSLVTAIEERLGRKIKGMRFLLPRGDLAKSDLPVALRERGAIVDELVVYKTVKGVGVAQLWALIEAGQVDVVTFSSSSAIRYFVEGAGDMKIFSSLNRPKVFVIGPIARDTACSYNLPVDGMASQYDSAGLVSCIVETIDRT